MQDKKIYDVFISGKKLNPQVALGIQKAPNQGVLNSKSTLRIKSTVKGSAGEDVGDFLTIYFEAYTAMYTTSRNLVKILQSVINHNIFIIYIFIIDL